MITRQQMEQLAALKALYQAPEEPPTRCFFEMDLLQAASNYGGLSADQVRADVERVERTIAYYDNLRAEHNLDVIDLAIVITRRRKAHAQTADGIAAMLCSGYWVWDAERHGERYASRTDRRSREQWEAIVAARLAQHGEPSLGAEEDWFAALSDADTDFLRGIAKRVKAGTLIVDMDADDRARLDALEASFEASVR